MRYQSSLPFRARAGSASKPSNPLAIQRAQPSTCVVSLASVTVSMSSGESSSSTDQDQAIMQVDPVPGPSTTGAIPFPTSSKRTHSLLRSIPSHPRQSPESAPAFPQMDESSESDTGASTDPDFNPPRKRTRTSALSSSARPRAQRCTAPIALLPQLAEAPSASSLTSCVAAPSSNPATISATSVVSTPWRRRRWSPGDLRVLLYLYRTLVYGLEVKYPNLLMECTSTNTDDDSLRADRTYLDVQDAILAQHLKTHLQESGAAPYMLVVDALAVAREGESPQSDPEPVRMVVDAGEVPPLPHLHLHPSTTHSVLSYPQLVATLLLRQTLFPHRPPRRISSRADAARRRRPSALSQCIFAES